MKSIAFTAMMMCLIALEVFNDVYYLPSIVNTSTERVHELYSQMHQCDPMFCKERCMDHNATCGVCFRHMCACIYCNNIDCVDKC